MAYATISKPSLYFNTVLYTGDGATSTAGTSARTISGVGFQPDFTWVKTRTNGGTAYMSHSLHDIVRGVPKTLESNSNAAQNDVTTGYGSGGIGSFTSDGFNIHSGTSGGTNNYNGSGSTYVAWNWKAGTGQGSSNTDGSINTTYTSVNTTAGFSIIGYAGTGSSGTIGHGLSATPKVCIFKEYDGTESWRVWHRDAPNYSTKALKLNGNDAEFNQSNWVGTVDNSIITIGSDSSINTNGNNYICYAFAEKKGYSRFGSYTGNGSTDGVFIYTGFKPAFVMTKKTSDTADWMIRDNKRLGYNGGWGDVYANNTNAENTNDANTQSDLLSNGFKLRMSHTNHNQSGGNYIFMAFAEEPLVANVGQGVPSTAR